MKTVSINVMNLCMPCENRCKYCLLSYNGKVSGVDYKRSEAYAKRFYDWIKTNRSDLSFLFGFGYSMEHPNLTDAVDFCRSIGSPTGEFLQFDGMKFRTDDELETLLLHIKKHGVKLIDLTFYGTEEYHDHFAARSGDFQLMMRTLAKANKAGLDVNVSIPVTHENVHQLDSLIGELMLYNTHQISCFVPHSEGRGQILDSVRLTSEDYKIMSTDLRKRINWSRFKTESKWIQSGFPLINKRVLTVTLTTENIEFFESMSFADTISYLEKLDNDYYSVIPPVEYLAKLYGNPDGNFYYSARDLYMHYQRCYITDNNIKIHDINDERQCFSRRF